MSKTPEPMPEKFRLKFVSQLRQQILEIIWSKDAYEKTVDLVNLVRALFLLEGYLPDDLPPVSDSPLPKPIPEE